MRKDDSNAPLEWCKHTRKGAKKGGQRRGLRRYYNKRIRRKVKVDFIAGIYRNDIVYLEKG